MTLYSVQQNARVVDKSPSRVSGDPPKRTPGADQAPGTDSSKPGQANASISSKYTPSETESQLANAERLLAVLRGDLRPPWSWRRGLFAILRQTVPPDETLILLTNLPTLPPATAAWVRRWKTLGAGEEVSNE